MVIGAMYVQFRALLILFLTTVAQVAGVRLDVFTSVEHTFEGQTRNSPAVCIGGPQPVSATMDVTGLSAWRQSLAYWMCDVIIRSRTGASLLPDAFLDERLIIPLQEIARSKSGRLSRWLAAHDDSSSSSSIIDCASPIKPHSIAGILAAIVEAAAQGMSNSSSVMVDAATLRFEDLVSAIVGTRVLVKSKGKHHEHNEQCIGLSFKQVADAVPTVHQIIHPPALLMHSFR